MIGSYAQMRANVPGLLLLAEDQRRAALRVAARDERRIAGEAEVLGDGEHVVGEAVPRVVDVGRVAVAVAAEVERPHVAARARRGARATGAQTRPWKPVGCASSTGAPVAAPVVHDEPDAVRVEVVRCGRRSRGQLLGRPAACSAAWSAIAFMIALAARFTNSPPLPVTQSHDACRAFELAGEVRHHVLREQLEAVLRRGRARPVVTEQQERAEAARLVDERLDLRDRVVGRADDREAVLVDVRDDLLGRVAARRARRAARA